MAASVLRSVSYLCVSREECSPIFSSSNVDSKRDSINKRVLGSSAERAV